MRKYIFKLLKKVRGGVKWCLGIEEPVPVSEIERYRNMGVKIGENVNMYDTYIDNGHPYLCEIGSNVTLSCCSILTHDASMHMQTGYSKIGKVIIGNNVFIGFKSIILCNVRIGDNVIIGAGSVVTKDIPSNSVAAGNPARIIGDYDSYIQKHVKNLKSHPVYNTYWKYKTAQEKEIEMQQLCKTYGYDV